MRFTRRQFVRGGVSAFTIGFAAPQFLSELALAQGGGTRNLVVVYLNGGNDALSTLVPYGDSDYYARRPTIAVPAGSVIQIGTDRGGTLLGLHPQPDRPEGPLRQRQAGGGPADRLPELEPLAFPGLRHLGHRQPHRRAAGRAGWAATSTPCPRRSIRWSPGTRRARHRAR